MYCALLTNHMYQYSETRFSFIQVKNRPNKGINLFPGKYTLAILYIYTNELWHRNKFCVMLDTQSLSNCYTTLKHVSFSAI